MKPQRGFTLVEVVFAIIATALIVAMIYGAWSAKRWFNEFFFYEGATQKTVCSMVHAEHLTEEGQRICKK